MNQYDNPEFFEAYARMSRSQCGLEGAGEWRQLQPLFPDLNDKTVLDLGCGYGWHCKYAAQEGAVSVLGLDQSARMIWEARKRNTAKPGGVFLFNIEHPIFTAGVNQQFSADGTWPVTDYYHPGERKTDFLGHTVTKQHHTLTQILMGLIHAGFLLEAVEEAMPPIEWRNQMPEEMLRPMMLLVKAKKEN